MMVIKKGKKLSVKNKAPLRSCIFIDNAEDLDIVISMYDLLEYIDNDSMTS